MNTTNNPGTPSKPDNSKTTIIIIAAIAGAILLGLNIVQYVTGSKQKTELTSQLDESQQLKAELEKNYYAALSDLEQMRGSNEELNALIEKQKEELTSQKGQIDKLLANKGDLTRARSEIKKLNELAQTYLAEINQLKDQVQGLTVEKDQLTQEKMTLSTDLEKERATSQELSTVKATLISEKEELEKTRAILSKKVTAASAIKVDGIEVTGLKTRKSGKAVKNKSANDIDQLQICFNTSANQVVDPGDEYFYIRIINPLGETLTTTSQGSGILKSSLNDDEIRYTTLKEIAYNQNPSNLCSLWKPEQPLTKGNYEVQVFNKGYEVGKSSFELK